MERGEQMKEELVPLTLEAEKEHERFIERCRRSLER